MNTQISPNFDVRQFVPKEVFTQFGENSKWFVSHSIVNAAEASLKVFTDHYKAKYPNVLSVKMIINNWHEGGTFNWRGLRTYKYIAAGVDAANKNHAAQPATMSQHMGGSTNAIDQNIVLVFKDKSITVDSNEVRSLILANEKYFMDAGITTLEDGHFAPTWCHMDCRWTGLDHIFVMKP